MPPSLHPSSASLILPPVILCPPYHLLPATSSLRPFRPSLPMAPLEDHLAHSQAQILEQIFVAYARVIKNGAHSPLLPAALKVCPLLASLQSLGWSGQQLHPAPSRLPLFVAVRGSRSTRTK